MKKYSIFYKIVFLISLFGLAFYGAFYVELLNALVKNKPPVPYWEVSMLKIDEFQNISSNSFIYSAYLDTRMEEPVVKIIGIGSRIVTNETLPKCFLVYKEPRNDPRLKVTVAVRLRKDIINDHHHRKFAAATFVCKLIGYLNASIIYPIKLVLQDVGSQMKVIELPVKTLEYDGIKKKDLTICVRPFYGPFKNTRSLAEFMAFYRVMGVNHFAFYDYQTRENVKLYLQELQYKYTNQSASVTIDILPWKCPKNLNVWQYGQIAALQDCIYRYTSRYKYVMPIDVDEYIVPREKSHKNILQMLKSWDTPKIGAFLFRMSVFCRPKIPKAARVNQLGIVHSLTREKYIFPQMKRSKAILKPYLVVEAAIHYIRNFTRKNYRHLMVESNMTLVHHLKGCRSKQVMRDETILRIKDYFKNPMEIRLLKELFGT